MPALITNDDLAVVATLGQIDAALLEIENFPVQASDLNVFNFDALSRSRMKEIVDHFSALDASSEVAHQTWRLTNGSSVAVDATTATNYFDDLSERAAIRATQAWEEYLIYAADSTTTLRDLESWKDIYRV